MLCCSVAPHVAYTNASTQSSVSCSFIMNVLKVELIVHQEIDLVCVMKFPSSPQDWCILCRVLCF